MPRARPVGERAPPARLLRGERRAPPGGAAARRAAPSDTRRGPCPAACAHSSTKLSTTNAVCVWPTERHQRTGTPVRGAVEVHGDVGNRVGEVAGPLDRGRVDPVLDHAARRACPPGSTDRRWCGATPPARRRRRGPPRCANATSAGSSRRGCRPRASRRPSPGRLRRLRDLHGLDARSPTSASRAGRSRRPGGSCGSGPARASARPPSRRSSRSSVWNCVPVQISHRSAVEPHEQLSGSIGAWARYGIS